MPFLARPQNRTDIAPRRLRKPVARHGGSGAGRIDEAIEPGLEVSVIDFLVVATVEVGEPGIDAPSQALELQRILARRCCNARMASRMASLALRYSPVFSISSMNASCSGVG